jgi:hypothetical protein
MRTSARASLVHFTRAESNPSNQSNFSDEKECPTIGPQDVLREASKIKYLNGTVFPIQFLILKMFLEKRVRLSRL